MATATQYNPNQEFNGRLLQAGTSKTVYALVTPEVEQVRLETLKGSDYLDQFRGAWTGKQDALHEEFFSTWREWAAPLVDFDPRKFPFAYPTAGASEPLRHIIYGLAARHNRTMMPLMIHIFQGEYEGYKAMAEACGVQCMEWDRNEWQEVVERFQAGPCGWANLFMVSAPSAIDGNVWPHLNSFLDQMPRNSVLVDVTYVGAIPGSLPVDRFDLTKDSISHVVFSLSKPFGVYYDRIGGVFCRQEDLGLFGNKWFKNLTSLRFGTALMKRFTVFDLPNRYRDLQIERCVKLGKELPGLILDPSDVYILATGTGHGQLADYLTRAGKVRLCLTPGMARAIGTAGDH